MLELFALREASLIVVQPLMSVGLIGLVFAARVFLDERIDWRTVLAAAAVASGIVCVILAVPSDASAVRLAHPIASSIVLAVLALAVVSAYVGPGKDSPGGLSSRPRRGTCSSRSRATRLPDHGSSARCWRSSGPRPSRPAASAR